MKNKKAGIIILLVAILTLILAACGTSGGTQPAKNATPLVLGELNIVENTAEITLFKVRTTEKITASMAGDIFFQNQNSGETYVDMIFDIKNLAAADVFTEDFMTANAKGETGTDYSASLYAIETNNGTYISTYENIAPLGTERFHCAFSVPTTETKITANISVGEKTFTYTYNIGNTVNQSVALNKGDKLEAEDYATMVFKGIDYTSDLLPSNTSGVYNHYEVDNPDNTYLVVKYDITNLQSTAKDAETFVGIKAIYMDKYTYTGFVVVEESDKTGFNSYESIKPLSKASCYCLIEVPKTVAENEVELEIAFNSKEYSFKGQ